MLKKLSLKPFWVQALVVVSPIVLAILFPILLQNVWKSDEFQFDRDLFIGQVFTLFCFFLFGWQYYLGIMCLKKMGKRALFFTLNGFVSVACWGFVVVVSLIGDLYFFDESFSELMENVPADNDWIIGFSYFMNFIIIHGIITLILNPYLIKRIHRNSEKERMIETIGQEAAVDTIHYQDLQKQFIRPMRLFAILPFVLVFAMAMFILLNDLFRLTS